MSEKQKQPREIVLPVALRIAEALQFSCQKLEIAGSLRRRKAMIGDIEIVALPRFDLDLFGEPAPTMTSLDAALRSLLVDGTIAWDEMLSRNGDRYKRFVVPALDGMGLDLFLAQPDNYGNVLTIRTGSAEFSARMMTQRAHGGLMPSGMRQQNGFLWDGDQKISCPTEEAFFAALGVTSVPPPEDRDEACIERLKRGAK